MRHQFESDGDFDGEHELMAVMATLLMAKKKTRHVWPRATKCDTGLMLSSCASLDGHSVVGDW